MTVCDCSVCQRTRIEHPDYLTTLPPELLRYISSLVHAVSPKQYLGGVARVFLPIARELFFRRVEVRSFSRLALLCGIMRKDEVVGEFVESMAIDLDEETADPGFPKNKKVHGLFRRLFALTYLSVTNAPRLALAVLSPPYHGECLSALETLSLEDKFSSLDNPFDPRHYEYLDMYPSLEQFDLEVTRSLSSIRKARAKVSACELYASPACLQLSGFLRNNRAVPALLESFLGVCALYLWDKTVARTDNLSPLLRSVPDPEQLTFLSLGSACDDDEDISDALSTFTNLYHIEFQAGSWTSAVLEVLPLLEHLRRICFYRWADVSCSDLAAILSGDVHIKELKKIILQKVVFAGSGDVVCGGLQEKKRLSIGWTDKFTLDGLVPLLDLAETRRIELTGLAVEVAKERRIEMEAEKEKRRAAKERLVALEEKMAALRS
ncbi:hypothetical protein JCM6882_002756 [Rhodosporidiobolus microsporus]